MRYLQDRYETWSRILRKHEVKWEEKKLYNLDALHSNYCQAVRELTRGRMAKRDFEDLEMRYEALKAQIVAYQIETKTESVRSNLPPKSEAPRKSNYKGKKPRTFVETFN